MNALNNNGGPNSSIAFRNSCIINLQSGKGAEIEPSRY